LSFTVFAIGLLVIVAAGVHTIRDTIRLLRAARPRLARRSTEEDAGG
jgi:hypothetical protein